MSPSPVPTRAARPYQGRADADPKGIVPGVRSAGLEPAATWPSTMPVCQVAARAQESRHPVPTRVIRRTKAEPQPCAAAKLGNLGSNQEPLGSEPSALPDCAIPHRVRKVRFERTSREV
jgi:hypothetical protein